MAKFIVVYGHVTFLRWEPESSLPEFDELMGMQKATPHFMVNGKMPTPICRG
jgi:hypothetical protein